MPDVSLPPRPALVVIPNVPLVEVGEEWPASTGPWTVTPEDIAAAVAAQDDPAVRSPIIRLGHVRAGQPAFGRFTNLRATNNGMTLVADLVGAPAWMADLLPYAFPSRSVEASLNETTETGHTHACRINAVALLGVELPAISTLDEVAAVYSASSMEEANVTLSAEVAAARGGTMPDPVQIAAALTTEDVRRAYYDQLGPGQDWWWIREMSLDPLALIVDDEQGGLWRVPVTVSGDEVTFGQPEAVRVEYVAAGRASATPAAPPSIVYADRAESRGGIDNVADLSALRSQLGLGDDVSDDDVIAQAATRLAAPPPDGTDSSTTPGTPDTTTTPAGSEPATVAASQVPPGMVLISQAVLDELQQGAAQGVAASQTLARQAEDAFIARHRRRIGASTNPHAALAEESLRGRWRADQVAAETFAASLPVLVPTVAAGHEDPGDDSFEAGQWTEEELRAFPELRRTVSR